MNPIYGIDIEAFTAEADYRRRTLIAAGRRSRRRTRRISR